MCALCGELAPRRPARRERFGALLGPRDDFHQLPFPCRDRKKFRIGQHELIAQRLFERAVLFGYGVRLRAEERDRLFDARKLRRELLCLRFARWLGRLLRKGQLDAPRLLQRHKQTRTLFFERRQLKF